MREIRSQAAECRQSRFLRLAWLSRRRFRGSGRCEAWQQFRMVRQELLDRLFDQVLHRNAAQNRRNLELAVFDFGNTCAELGFGLGVAGWQGGIQWDLTAVHAWIRPGFLGRGHCWALC
jgi:hypothetical protein